jgi:hypothetical protein
MSTAHKIQSVAYAEAVASLVADMPPERASQVYDFARFLQAQIVNPSPLSPPDPLAEEDWLNDSEEQMQAEDALWDAATVRHRDKFASLAAEAKAEIKAGTTKPLFTESGELELS